MIFLDQQAWAQKYNELHLTVSNEFFKLEILPSYNDYNITDWDNIHNTAIRDLIIKSQISVSSAKTQIQHSINNGARIKRVRYIEFPLSKYILRQFSVYKMYSDMGVEISILEGHNTISDISKSHFRDFLLFDEQYLLLIDNPNGCFSGGMFSNIPTEIAPFIEVRNKVLAHCIDFNKYIYNFNIDIRDITI